MQSDYFPHYAFFLVFCPGSKFVYFNHSPFQAESSIITLLHLTLWDQQQGY